MDSDSFGDDCGGLLEGETGHFSFGNASNQEKPESSNSACLWVIQLHYETNIRFTLNGLDGDAHLNLYSEDQLTSCSLSNYTRLNSTQIGSSFEFLGKTLIVVLPNSSFSVAFSWHFAGNNGKNSSVATMKNSDYIISPNGLLDWEQLEPEERKTWAINPNANFHLRWDVQVAKNLDSDEYCGRFYFGIFQLTSKGVLSEAVRTCGQSSEGKLERVSGRAVVLIKVNTKVQANKVAISWKLDDETVTEPPPPVTAPPEPTAAGIFAATSQGLLAFNLQTLEATALTSDCTFAVAVNPKLNKVYWSESEGLTSSNQTIIRSNLDGSEREIIVPPTGDLSVASLAIDVASGSVYFSRSKSHEITVCNALGKNCATVISSPSLVNSVSGIALDSDNGVMYWANSGPNSLVRANLDGSNATIISTGFKNLHDITMDPASKDVIYWTDYGELTIGTIDVRGGNKQTLLELSDPLRLPWGIQVDNVKIYFSTADFGELFSVDRNSGEFTTILNFVQQRYVLQLALYNAPINQS